MIRWWIHRWQSCRLRLLRGQCGNLGMRFHVMWTKSLDMVHGFWRSFSGTARLTTAVRALGVPCLPPIDITVCQEVPSPFDVLDCDKWSFIMKLIACGAIKFIHFGTPCNSFSAARKEDGGPPPLRSEEFPEGFPDLDGLNLAITMLGNFFAERTVEAAEAVVRAGGDFSIENPRWSLLWCTIWIRRLMREARTFQVDFDQCAFGAASMKPTRILMSHQRLQAGLARKCPGNHAHEVLKGKVWSDQFGKVVFRTKLAQVYPHAMCSQMARDIEALWSRPLEHFAPLLLFVFQWWSQTSYRTKDCVEGAQTT